MSFGPPIPLVLRHVSHFKGPHSNEGRVFGICADRLLAIIVDRCEGITSRESLGGKLGADMESLDDHSSNASATLEEFAKTHVLSVESARNALAFCQHVIEEGAAARGLISSCDD